MANTPPKSSDVRQWARSKGIEVGERGRLSPDVLAAYGAAHGGPAVKPAAKSAPAKKAAAKKRPAKKAAAKKSPAKRAAAKKAPARLGSSTPSRVSNPPVESAPVERLRPAAISTPPAVTVDSSRVAALEEQIAKLASRLERIETARAAAPKRGLFSRK